MPRKSQLKTTTAVLRSIIGLSDEEMATLIGRSKSTIWQLESGRRKLTDELAAKISHETGVLLSWLLLGDPGIPPESKDGTPYDLAYFEDYIKSVKGSDSLDRSSLSMVFAWMTIRLRQILYKANQAHSIHMFCYKADRLFAALEKEFSEDPLLTVVHPPDAKLPKVVRTKLNAQPDGSSFDEIRKDLEAVQEAAEGMVFEDLSPSMPSFVSLMVGFNRLRAKRAAQQAEEEKPRLRARPPV